MARLSLVVQLTLFWQVAKMTQMRFREEARLWTG